MSSLFSLVLIGILVYGGFKIWEVTKFRTEEKQRRIGELKSMYYEQVEYFDDGLSNFFSVSFTPYQETYLQLNRCVEQMLDINTRLKKESNNDDFSLLIEKYSELALNFAGLGEKVKRLPYTCMMDPVHYGKIQESYLNSLKSLTRSMVAQIISNCEERILEKNYAAIVAIDASPGRVVTNRNHFLGTMMISLCEFEGKELIKSESFERLIQFLDSNKEYIHFVIHILPEFKEKQELLTRLRKLMHVMEVTLTIPDVNDSYAYIMKELVRRKYLITDEVADNLKQEILPVLCASKAFCGYTTLENLIHRIAYELVFDQDRNTVTEAKLRKIVEEMSMEIVEEGIGIGFIR